MSEPKLISPLLDHFAIGGAISTHDGVSCYPAMREDSDEKYIVKVISIPASQVKLEALLLTGAYPNTEAARKYFEELVSDVENEAQVLRHLAKLEGFLAYDDYQVVPMDEGVGYHIYLLSSYKRSLSKHFRNSPMTHLAAVNLGIDLCAAMTVCRQVGCLYIDLKPDNIFISDDGRYRVGDLGFIPMSSLKYASLPDKYRSSWTAPEVEDAFSSLNATMDIYAIGLVLYQAYNNGTLPFEGAAPKEVLPPPLYADYEMSEIILKACAVNPEERWQDPKELGQALVSYMQRNGANDTPIVPPAVPVVVEPQPEALADDQAEPDIPDLSDVEPDATETLDPELAETLEMIFGEEAEAPAPEDPEVSDTPKPEDVPQDEVSAQSEVLEEVEEETEPEIPDELSFISSLVSDETVPSVENGVEVDDTVLSDELSDILAQADELLAHEPPAPVIVPDPIDIPMPEPIPPEEPETQTDPMEENLDDSSIEASEETESTEPDTASAPSDDEDSESDDIPAEEDTPRKSHKGLIAWIITLLILTGLAVGGYYFYNHHYLQNIDKLSLQGSDDVLTVEVDTNADESLLTVVCTDTYGATMRKRVENGVATFDSLKPGSQYSVTVEISGFHKLTGMTSASHSTPPETEILNFSAIAGPEDGSVILSFTVDGQESDSWTISYQAEGEDARSVSFTGHTVTISGLRVDQAYTFTIVPAADLYLVGTTELTYSATRVIYAENLAVTACDGESLTAQWNAPADSNVTSWDVRCYNDAGYDQTITVTECSATFTGIDTSSANTIEVMASGMTQCSRTFITANPVTIGTIHGSNTDPNSLLFQWGFIGEAPEGGWLLVYTVEGSQTEEFIQCSENSAVISPVIPGAAYQFTIQAANGATVFGGSFTSTAPAAEDFSGYGVTNANMEFSMCRTPDAEDWGKDDLQDEDYTTTFTVGDQASFLVHLNIEYNVEYEEIVTLYVIRDAEGNLVSADSQNRLWVDMWNLGYCELDIPALPQTAGKYTMELYFNGAYLTTQVFTME